METYSTGVPSSPAAADESLSQIEATAPEEIRSDAAEFVRLARTTTNAFAAAGATERELTAEEVQAVLDGLPAEVREFVEELANQASQGEASDTPAGRVAGYYAANCL